MSTSDLQRLADRVWATCNRCNTIAQELQQLHREVNTLTVRAAGLPTGQSGSADVRSIASALDAAARDLERVEQQIRATIVRGRDYALLLTSAPN